MTTEHRKAPRRKIDLITRMGVHGSVKYHHFLECGHTEIRPRASRAPKLGCAWCFRVEQAEPKFGAVVLLSSSNALDYDERLSKNEVEVARLHGSLAKALGVPTEAVDLVVTENGADLSVESAVVFLSPRDIDRLTRG